MRSIWLEMTNYIRLSTRSPILNRLNAIPTLPDKPHGLFVAGLISALNGHPKTGHRGSLQNRPYERGQDMV